MDDNNTSDGTRRNFRRIRLELCPHLQRSTFGRTRAAAMMPDRKWCHDVMRHARHGDASPEHSPRHEYAKNVRATRVNNTAHEETC